MAGYSRQSTADIIANAVIKAAPVNAEYNALRDAFLLSGGHKHDGSSTEGAYVPLIADTDALNKVVIDTSNNRIGFFSEVSSAAVEQIRIQDGAIVPVTDNDIDLGTSSLEFKDLYIDGVGYLDSVDIDGGTIDNAVIGGTTAAAGSFTTITGSGNASVGGTLGVTGNVTMGGTLAVTGTTALTGTATITSADINSGAMDNTTIGNTTAAAGTFTNLTSTGTSTHATVDINGGAIDGVTIGAASAGAGTFTDLTASGTTTITTADINGGNIDGTTIGASSAAAGSFTTVSTTGQATLATADINGGTIDGAIIGGSTAAAITGTTITGTSLVGAVTGNVTGDLTGDVTGDVTGNLTGNVTAGSGASTFNNVTVNGTLDVTGTTIANVTDPSNAQDAATKNYVDTEVSALVDSAPGTLNTLNELAAALGDDASFSTTITNSIATKLPLAGGTMSGAIAMGTSKITGLGDPTANQDAATKKYTTDTFLPLAGGTLTGAIDMGSAKITTTYTPTNNADLTTKTYVDGVLGSATAAATSATAAASSATAAASSATAAASSATGAASSATSAAASYDSFDDRYLGAKSSAPTVDNDGDALVTGALYFNSTTDIMNVRTSGGAWTSAGSSVNGTSSRNTYTATAGQTTFASTYDSGYVDVYLNGVKLLVGTDFTATNGTSVVLASGAAVNDIVDIVAYGTFTLSDHYTKTQSDARYLQLSGGTLTGGLTGTTATFSGDVDIADKIVHTGDTNTSIRFPAADTVTVETGGSERMRIASDGSVGIGNSNPSDYSSNANNLVVGTTSGHNGITISSGTDSYGSIYFSDGTSGVSQYRGIVQYIHSQEQMRFYTNAAQRMVIDSSGDVGIGDSAPVSTLEISKSDQTNGTTLTITNAFSGGSWAVNDVIGSVDFRSDDASSSELTRGRIQSVTDDVTGTNWSYGTALTFSTAFNNTLSERLRINSSGDVGIGVTPGNPGWARNLHVHGAGNGGGLQLTDNTSGSGNNDGLSIASYQGNSYFINRENAFMAFSTNDTERMRIDSTGRLLVGKSVTTFSTAGHTIYHDGSHDLTASAIPPIQANRLSSDGDVIAIFKDSSQVGSIASVNGNIKVSAYGEEYASLSGTSVTIDCQAGNNFALTTSGNTTFTFSNAPTSGTAFGFTLKLTSGGSHTITYPNSVDFAGATAPDAPASGETDVLVFYTVDGGTNWYGALAIDAAG